MNIRDIHIYKGKKSHMLSALTTNDAIFWGADVFVATVFAFFVLFNIEGGSATHVGIMFAVYRILRGIASIPLGKYFDQKKGYADEFWGLAFSGVFVGSIYIMLFFATELWQVYLAMAAIGMGHAFNVNSWKILFYGSISKGHQGEVVGAYEAVMQIVYALSAVIAGFAGDTFGFQWVMVVAGVLTILSSVTPMMLRNESGKNK